MVLCTMEADAVEGAILALQGVDFVMVFALVQRVVAASGRLRDKKWQ